MTEYTFASRSHVGLNFTDELPDITPGYWTRREDIPDWLTSDVVQNILYTIDELKRANVRGNVMVYIPLHWVEVGQRHKYRDAQLFGVPLQLNEYAAKPQVAVFIKEKPKR